MPLTDQVPWLNFSPEYFLNAAEGGARLGLERRGQDISASDAAGRLGLGYAELGQHNALARMEAEKQRQAMEQHMKEFQAAQDLKRAALTQQGLLGGERLDLEKERIGDLADYRSGLLDSKKTPGDFVTVATRSADGGVVQRKVPTDLYDQFNATHAAWESGKPSATVPGRFYGVNPNPALDEYAKTEPKLEDFLTKANSKTQDSEPSAAESLSVKTPMGTASYSPSGQPPSDAAMSLGGMSVPVSASSVDLASTNSPTNQPLRTATNPKTGEKLVLKDGKWQPLNQ